MSATKKKSVFRFLATLVGIVILFILSTYYSFRIDLTEEKRYTLSTPTKELLKNIEDQVYIEIYLTGDLPSGFRRLEQSIEEQLNTFQSYAGKNIRYSFFDPTSIKDIKKRNEYVLQLARRGIPPTTIFDTENGKRTEKIVFPGALVIYQNRETVITFLKGNKGNSPQEILNQSIENIEFELASAIRNSTEKERKKIAWIEGHGELTSIRVADIANSIGERYNLFRSNLPGKKSLDGYDAIIIAKPTQKISEADKYKIDQFILKGGKALFLIDEIQVEKDSIGTEGTFAFTYNHNLDDLLFKYGIRVNANLIQDLYAGVQPIVTGNMGSEPQIQLLPWPFFPIINSFGESTIVKNTDAILTRFVSSIDTVKATGVKKTPLLFTSNYTRLLFSPVRINFNDMRKELTPQYLNKGPFMIACLLEGNFHSVFKNRTQPEGIDTTNFKEEGTSKIIVCSDGDMVRNELDPRTHEPLPLGFDPYTQHTFANKDFIINALEYLLNSDGVILAKKKEIKLRPLDKVKAKEEKLKYQLINIILPILLVIIAGISRSFWRKRKFEKTN